MGWNKIKHNLGTRESHVTVLDADGNDLVFHTSICHDTVNECSIKVDVPGRHRVIITNGEHTYAEWVEVN